MKSLALNSSLVALVSQDRSAVGSCGPFVPGSMALLVMDAHGVLSFFF